MDSPKSILRNLHINNAKECDIPLSIPASPLLKNLGYGTGVNVYYLERSPRATGLDRSPWAIKRISKRIRATNKENSKLFNDRIVKEAEVLRQLKHPNIVGFRSITRKNGVDTLALECCTSSLGLLLERRLEEDLTALPACNTKKMMCDISCALDYLHSTAKILHGDLKSHNVLVKGEFEICKLCDFGVSLPLNEEGFINLKENPQVQYVGTHLWSAPEVIREDDIIDSKADVFSFGLTVYETIALVPPHTLNFNESETLPSDCEASHSSSVVTETADNFTLTELAYGTRPPLPQAFELSDEYNIIVELFYLCTNSCPDDRPSAKIIYESLTKSGVKK